MRPIESSSSQESDEPNSEKSPSSQRIAGPPIPGSSPAAEPVTEKEEPKARTYTVKSGDNPWAIAKEHGVSLDELMAVNGIEDAKNLQVGDTLTIPSTGDQEDKSKRASREEAPEVSSGSKPEEEAPGEGDAWVWYTVGKGENPWAIARKLRVDHQEVMKLNEGLDFTQLEIGQKIKVPKN